MELHFPPQLNNYWWVCALLISFTTIRYILLPVMAYLIFYYPFFKWLKKFKIQSALPAGKQIRHELLYSLSTILIFSSIGIVAFFLYANGLTTIYTNLNQFGNFYFFLSLLGMILIHDAYFYWTHRLLHTRWFFKNIHRVHHKSVNPTPLTAYAFHPMEALIESLVIFPFITIFPVHYLAFTLFTFLVLFMNVIGHLGFEFIPLKSRNSLPFKYLTSSTHHNLHHQKSNKNFGYYFTFWDKMMKTLQNEILRAKI